MERKKIILSSCIQYFIPLILIVIFYSYRLGENLYPVIYGDEYGYWAAGSFFAGLNWEEITTINPYYGYGYGVFLALILKVVENPLLDYKVALYFNVFAVCLCYIIILCTEKRLLKFSNFELNDSMQALIALIISCYPSNLQFVNYTMAEIPTMLFTWVGFYCMVKCIENNALKNHICLLVVSIVLIMIHMRNLGMFIVIMFFELYTFLVRKNYKQLVKVLIVCVFGILLFVSIKSFYTDSYYVVKTGVEHNTNNEIGGVISKLASLFTISTLAKLATAMIAKLYYMLVASYGFAIIPFVKGIKSCIKIFIKKKAKIEKMDIILAFEFGFAIIMMMICSIFMIDYDTRFDLLLYGRYFENIIPLLTLVGLLLIITGGRTIKWINIIGSMCIIFWLGKFVEFNQNYALPKGNVFINLTPVAEALIRGEYAEGTLLFLGGITGVIFGVICLIARKKKNIVQKIFISLCLFFLLGREVYVGHYVLDNGLYSWSIKENNSELELLEMVTALGIQDELFFWPEGYVLAADGLQYLLKYNSIHVCGNLSGNENYLITSKKNNNKKYLEDLGYVSMIETERLILWEKEIR